MLGNRMESSVLPAIVRQSKVDALIVLAGVFEPEAFEKLKDCPVPLCIVDGHVDTIKADTLTSDGFGGGRLVAQHLIDNGHQEMLMIAYDSPLYNIERRIAGFLDGLGAAGIKSPQERLVIRVVDNQQASALLLKRLKEPNPPTAVFAVNDTLAKHLVSTLSEAGMVIPDDVSIVGFDDDPLAAECNPPLTTIGMAKRDFGVISAKLVLDRLAHPDMTPVHQIQPTRLVIRQSVKKLETTVR
jgi:LacI family transcriptional regulator